MPSNNTENQPPQTPLSPPDSTRKPITRSAIHAFFTPRHRSPLGEVSSTSSTRNASGLVGTPTPAGSVAFAKNVHLLSPEDSPSNRASKKARRVLFPASEENNESGREVLFAPISGVGAVKGKKLFPGSGKVKAKAGDGAGDIFDESKEEEQAVKERPNRIRPTGRNRVLMRMLGTGSITGMRSTRPHHCAAWRYEVEGFHSRPENIHKISSQDRQPCLPFTAKACHRNSLVGVGDETGFVRLIETEKDLTPSFSTTYLGIACHDNAVFDISWSPDDHRLATASGDQTSRVFDVISQQLTDVLMGHRSSVKQVAFNPRNPSILTTCSRDGNIHIWDLRCVGSASSLGKGVTEHKPVNSILQAHADTTLKKGITPRTDVSVTAVVWLINRDNSIATASEANSCIKIWDIRSIQTKRKVPAAVEFTATPPHHQPPKHRPFGLNCLSLSPDGARLYAMCRDSVVYAYSTTTIAHGPIHAYSHPRLHASTFYVKSSVSRDGRLLATGSSDGLAVLFPTDERYLDQNSYRHGMRHPEDSVPALSSLAKPSRRSILPVTQHLKVGKGVGLVRGHEKEVTDVAWSMNGDLVTISDDYQARCWRDDDGGVEAEQLRDCGEDEGRRWACGWAEKAT